MRVARENGLSNSRALEYAALSWLRDHGYWDLFLADPAPGRMVLVKPVRKGDFEPFLEWAEVAPYVDRWLSPPMVVLPGPDGTMPRVGEPCETFPAGGVA